MKLEFKTQAYQINAVESVVDRFEGQPNNQQYLALCRPRTNRALQEGANSVFCQP